MKFNLKIVAAVVALGFACLFSGKVSACDYGVQQSIGVYAAPQASFAPGGCYSAQVQAAPAYVERQVVVRQAAPVYVQRQFVQADPAYVQAAPVYVQRQVVFAAPAYAVEQSFNVGKIRSRGVVRGRASRGRVGVASQAVAGGGGVNINAAPGAKVKVK